MSFLDKIKTDKATTASTTTSNKPNPFAKPNPLASKKEEVAKSDSGEKKKLPFVLPQANKEETENKKALNPLAPKKLSLNKEEKPLETEETVEEIKEQKVEVETKEDVTVENTEEVQNETKETKEEIVEEIKEEVVETTEKETTKKTPGKGKRRNSKKKEEVPEEQEEENIDDTSSGPMTYSDAVEAIKSPFVDTEWETFRKEIDESLASIVILDDMNPSILKGVLADLSELRQKIWMPLQDTKTLYDQLSSKEPEGLIERIKRISFNEDQRNDMERKKAGIEACMSYISPKGEILNLYEVLDETRSRYNFLKATMDSIQYKSNILITMNGALKLEKDHTAAEV